MQGIGEGRWAIAVAAMRGARYARAGGACGAGLVGARQHGGRRRGGQSFGVEKGIAFEGLPPLVGGVPCRVPGARESLPRAGQRERQTKRHRHSPRSRSGQIGGIGDAAQAGSGEVSSSPRNRFAHRFRGRAGVEYPRRSASGIHPRAAKQGERRNQIVGRRAALLRGPQLSFSAPSRVHEIIDSPLAGPGSKHLSAVDCGASPVRSQNHIRNWLSRVEHPGHCQHLRLISPANPLLDDANALTKKTVF